MEEMGGFEMAKYWGDELKKCDRDAEERKERGFWICFLLYAALLGAESGLFLAGSPPSPFTFIAVSPLILLLVLIIGKAVNATVAMIYRCLKYFFVDMVWETFIMGPIRCISKHFKFLKEVKKKKTEIKKDSILVTELFEKEFRERCEKYPDRVSYMINSYRKINEIEDSAIDKHARDLVSKQLHEKLARE